MNSGCSVYVLFIVMFFFQNPKKRKISITKERLPYTQESGNNRVKIVSLTNVMNVGHFNFLAKCQIVDFETK